MLGQTCLKTVSSIGIPWNTLPCETRYAFSVDIFKSNVVIFFNENANRIYLLYLNLFLVS